MDSEEGREVGEVGIKAYLPLIVFPSHPPLFFLLSPSSLTPPIYNILPPLKSQPSHNYHNYHNQVPPQG